MKELESKIQELEKQLEILKQCKKILNPTLEYPASFRSYDDLKNWLNTNGIEYQNYFIYSNGDWSYYDEQWFYHLFRNGKELTKDVIATYCDSFANGDWQYTDEQWFCHLFRDGIELTKGIKAKYIYSFRNYDWCYVDEQGFHHLYRDGVELTKGVKVVSFFPYDDGDWYYTDNMGNNHRLNSNKIN